MTFEDRKIINDSKDDDCFISIFDLMKKLYPEYVNCLIGIVRCITKDKKEIQYIIISSSNCIAILRYRQSSRTKKTKK